MAHFPTLRLAAFGAATSLAFALQAQTARIQVVHNCADLNAASVDVYVNGSLAIPDFGFRTATPFIDLPSGTDLEIGIAPGNSSGPGDALFTQTFNLADGETYIAVASGTLGLGGYNPATPFTIEVYAGARESAQGSGTDVLALHGSTDAPTVDVFESAVVSTTIIDDFSYGDFAGYLELPTLDFSLQVRTANNSTIVAAYAAPLQTLGLQGAALTVLASGFLNPAANSNGPAFGLWVALPTGGPLVELPFAAIPTARIQAIHNSADAAAAQVDVYLNGGLLLDNFAFRTATPFVDVQAGVDLTLSIAPANSSSVADAIANFNYNLPEGGSFILVANGIVSPSGYSPATPFDIYVAADARESAQGPGTDVLVFHGCTDAPTVDVFESAVVCTTIVDDISYGEFDGYLELPTLDFTLQVRTADGLTTVASYAAPLQTLGLEGAALTVLASGFLNPSNNSNGAGFGLWVALPSGGALVELPIAMSVQEQSPIQSVSAWPNPALDRITLDVDAIADGNLEVLFIDATGRAAMAINNLPLNAGRTQANIDLNGLANGSYMISLRSAGAQRNIPVVIAR
ncbi:MAG TPA: DUF4397 domain-containing protein [Flavobacteriales bacterium]|nr:DUF4397 domain-containing protein [Flavobacteriales bacterium]